MGRHVVFGAAVVLAVSCLPPAVRGDVGITFFEKKIRPLLVAHCYRCHSTEKKQRGGLTLDTRDGVRRGGDSGPAIVPGKPDESLLLKAIRYVDPELQMPPKGKLPEEAIAAIEKWIAMGAPDPRIDVASAARSKALDLEAGRKFWAFQPPKRAPVPPVENIDWPTGPIDRFILARLEQAGLRPAPAADRTTLIRRAYFDLVGLPPSPREIDSFINDASPDAFARLVDRLLASPHFGERWGRHWLDVARYAESSGGGRSLILPDAWRYRDYVIDAFNADKPFDQFIREQLAGDLLTEDRNADLQTRRQRLIATAFLALGPTNYERQDKAILEMDVIDEQLDTIGRAFLGMTIGCARCHDHKFDPISTREYYALAGILKSTQTLVHDNVSRWVELPLPVDPATEAALQKHHQAVQNLLRQIAKAKAAEKRAGLGPVAIGELSGVVVDDTEAKRIGSWTHSRSVTTYVGKGYLHDGNSGKGEKTITFVPQFARPGHYEVRFAYTAANNRARRVPVTVLHLDGEKTFFIDQQKTPPIDGRFVSLGTFRFDTNGQWFVMVSNRDTTGYVIADAVQFIPESEQRALRSSRAKEPAAGAKPTGPSSKELEARLKRLRRTGPKRPKTMGVRDADKCVDCRICIRGNFHNQGERVPRGFLQVVTIGKPPTIPSDQSGRLQLAQWIASENNPLTARVIVNRIWHWLFGCGIVRTVDTFGTAGERPSHPELLDYLALRFMEQGWSVKRLIREIMLSQTYRMSSHAVSSPRAARIDPENRLCWRARRRRLDAECLRDAILVASGELDRRMTGPTIRPGTTSEYGYRFDDARRSVYTPIFRNQLHEMFEAFDFPDPNLVAGRRNVSTVAPQALFWVNNAWVLDRADRAALRCLNLKANDRERVRWAYRVTLGRPPGHREEALALRWLDAAAEDPSSRRSAMARLFQALFASIDFRYVE